LGSSGELSRFNSANFSCAASYDFFEFTLTSSHLSFWACSEGFFCNRCASASSFAVSLSAAAALSASCCAAMADALKFARSCFDSAAFSLASATLSAFFACGVEILGAFAISLIFASSFFTIAAGFNLALLALLAPALVFLASFFACTLPLWGPSSQPSSGASF